MLLECVIVLLYKGAQWLMLYSLSSHSFSLYHSFVLFQSLDSAHSLQALLTYLLSSSTKILDVSSSLRLECAVFIVWAFKCKLYYLAPSLSRFFLSESEFSDYHQCLVFRCCKFVGKKQSSFQKFFVGDEKASYTWGKVT